MQTTYWFAPKLMGWGFMPITIEGWIATFVLLAMMFLSAYTNDILVKEKRKEPKFLRSKPVARFIFDLIILVTLFTMLFADKVQGGLQWRFF